jgi:hypothetical protein
MFLKTIRYKELPTMTPEIISVIAVFACEFNRPTWKKVQTLLLGAILCRGARRITSVLRVMNLSHESNFGKYHRVLNHATWDGLALSKILLGLLVKLLPESWPILVAVDETLERRQGKKIKAKGIYRDAVRFSQSHVVTSYGLKWECMALIVPLPWCQRAWALPFLTLLSPSKKSNERAGRCHKTSIDWTQQMVILVSRWLHKAAWILVGDGAYACMALAQTCIKRNVTLLSRLRMDAQLFEFPEHLPKQLGRRRIKGKRIILKSLLTDLTQPWQSLVVNWYGGEQKTLECLSFTCLWYHAGQPPLTLRVVLVKTPGGKNEAEVFFSTDIALEPIKIINYFILRWNLEVTFFETRAHLGVETQRQWSDKAIQRTTPLLMGLYSLVTLIAIEMNKIKILLVSETTSWYDKKGELTFVDVISVVRRSIWAKRLSKSANHDDFEKTIGCGVKMILDQLSLAA